MPLAKPYTLKEAAAVLGMSRDWLRPRLVSVPELAEMKFRTSGATGHWRLPRAKFDAWAALFVAGEALPKPERPKRPRRKRSSGRSYPLGAPVSLLQVYRESNS